MADFAPNRLPDYNDESLIDELRRVANVVGGSRLTRAQFKEEGRVGLTTLRRRFGSWQQALDRAGLGHLYNDIGVTAAMRTQIGKSLRDSDLVQEMLRVADALGNEAMTVDAFNRHASIEANTLRRRFGSWREALKAAGLGTSNRGRRYTQEDCYENLLRVWTHYGRQPKYAEMNASPSVVGGKAYMARWGTWMKAIHAFCEYAVSDAHKVGEPGPAEPARAKNAHSIDLPLNDGDRHKMKLGLRYKILKRDCFKCVLCGRSPATTPGLELHVDHIQPFTKGGRTVESNLRTTCSDCNLGKGDTF